MKHIIIGLGSFGASLATKLTATGHEVIGVDKDMSKVEYSKNQLLIQFVWTQPTPRQ